MVVTLDQQYNVGEKPIVLLYTYINRHAGTPDKKKQCSSTSSNRVVIIYCFIGRKYKTSIWHFKGFSDGSGSLGSTV